MIWEGTGKGGEEIWLSPISIRDQVAKYCQSVSTVSLGTLLRVDTQRGVLQVHVDEAETRGKEGLASRLMATQMALVMALLLLQGQATDGATSMSKVWQGASPKESLPKSMIR